MSEQAGQDIPFGRPKSQSLLQEVLNKNKRNHDIAGHKQDIQACGSDRKAGNTMTTKPDTRVRKIIKVPPPDWIDEPTEGLGLEHNNTWLKVKALFQSNCKATGAPMPPDEVIKAIIEENNKDLYRLRSTNAYISWMEHTCSESSASTKTRHPLAPAPSNCPKPPSESAMDISDSEEDDESNEVSKSVQGMPVPDFPPLPPKIVQFPVGPRGEMINVDMNSQARREASAFFEAFFNATDDQRAGREPFPFPLPLRYGYD